MMIPVRALNILITAISLYLIKPVDIANCTASITLIHAHTVSVTVTAAAVKTTVISSAMRTAAPLT